MSEKHLCIHGHFYQPPREDPWLNKILPEGSAAPFRHWNERIARESYTPLAWARRMNGDGRIDEIINCYEWMSFNIGPTLFNWLERSDPELIEKLQDADRRSLKRWGHGNAIAQIYHHVIMPLATEFDKKVEVAWAVADFESRFNRKPEGMWLSETACDIESLEVLAEYGIKFTLLAPRQAESISLLGSGVWEGVDESSLDIRRPYLVNLPSGKSISIFFYDGGLSQSVAFEGLLRDGENFWRRLSGASHDGSGLLSIATDGETYGHHFEFGEMALAYVLKQAIENRDGISITNYAAFLEKNPPEYEVKIRDNSSWSCYHGVERWRSDCGCSTGGHPDWNQKWRKPLRDGLQHIKTSIDNFYLAEGQTVFKDPQDALLNYGAVLSGLISEDKYSDNYFLTDNTDSKDKGWAMLSMQKWALASFASCGWFFDDLARLEPVNNMTFALRAIEIAKKNGLEDLEADFISIISEAQSNEERYGSGTNIWDNIIKPRSESPSKLIAQTIPLLFVEDAFPSPGEKSRICWPEVEISIEVDSNSDLENLYGIASIKWHLESQVKSYSWKWNCDDNIMSAVVDVSVDGESFSEAVNDLPWKNRQYISLRWLEIYSERLWDARIGKELSVNSMFLSFDDYQSVQTNEYKWKELWPVMVYEYIFSEGSKTSPDLIHFLSEVGKDNVELISLGKRISMEICSVLSEESPDWEYLINAISKLKMLNLEINYWDIQNSYWMNVLREKQSQEFGRLIGF
ncbi:DUF3536 domain-containing protein [Maridesulfovibrio bastinii]|uniref:DUF3536 domain-containing protein n=1 Tax=Maridesulfovibrio bastinii TaxID=47157 RepID=UPI00042903CD|nr:DUF3536 domain-containing protein [Maridesulfovibrio bastinii]